MWLCFLLSVALGCEWDEEESVPYSGCCFKAEINNNAPSNMIFAVAMVNCLLCKSL